MDIGVALLGAVMAFDALDGLRPVAAHVLQVPDTTALPWLKTKVVGPAITAGGVVAIISRAPRGVTARPVALERRAPGIVLEGRVRELGIPVTIKATSTAAP